MPTESEQLRSELFDEMRALRAEIERLQFDITERDERLEALSVEAGRVSVALDQANTEIERLQAEIKRLQDHLESKAW